MTKSPPSAEPLPGEREALLDAWAEKTGCSRDDERVTHPEKCGWPDDFKTFRLGWQAGRTYQQQPSPPPSDALRAALSAAIDAVIWMSGSDDFSPHGKAHEGWLKVRPRIDEWQAALLAAPSAAEKSK